MSRYAPLLIVLLSIGACAANMPTEPSKAPRTAHGFRNTYPHPEKAGFWKWKWEQWREGLPHKPSGGYHFETTAAGETVLVRDGYTLA